MVHHASRRYHQSQSPRWPSHHHHQSLQNSRSDIVEWVGSEKILTGFVTIVDVCSHIGDISTIGGAGVSRESRSSSTRTVAALGSTGLGETTITTRVYEREQSVMMKNRRGSYVLAFGPL